MTPRHILITGATGGLGMALVREAVARGHTVTATGRSTLAQPALENAGARFVRCDLEDGRSDKPALLEGCDSVIHAAALSASWGPRHDFVSANLTVTMSLIEAARQSGVSRFVFVSSPSIHACFEDRVGITEEDPPASQPLNYYAETKLQAERHVLASSTPMMRCCAIRPRALVGEGDRVILPKLAQLARRRKMPLPGGGQALIELTDLRDAAWAICEAEQRAETIGGHAINISGGQPIKVRDLATRLAAALGTRPKLVDLPLPLAKAIAHAAETIAHLARCESEPVLTRYTFATLAYSQTFDLSCANRLLGYAPRHDATETLLQQARAKASPQDDAS